MCWQWGTRQDPHGQHLLSVRHSSLLVATASPHAPSCIHRNKWLTACWKVCVARLWMGSLRECKGLALLLWGPP